MSRAQDNLYYAHSAHAPNGDPLPHDYWQPLQTHAQNVGNLAGSFAEYFGAQDIACCTGQLHDLDKYSPDFNARLHGGRRVDHATAGAKIAVERWQVIGKLMAFCIAGHHAGLANGNGKGDNRSTLKQRLNLQFGADIPRLDDIW
ncbi:CRISPR-associated endonuclease Cas3'' [Aggregatibacter actinomycetemcomitans]|nr:CRISPR-associated endonuclease Cas3'' [Aggregatibacter actinomycetemcomitans]